MSAPERSVGRSATADIVALRGHEGALGAGEELDVVRDLFKLVGAGVYQLTQREDEDALTQAIVKMAIQYGRYGYRRITALLKRDGWQVGKDQVERIWRREGLKVPQRQKPRGRLFALNNVFYR
jgi:hypothetical protein